MASEWAARHGESLGAFLLFMYKTKGGLVINFSGATGVRNITGTAFFGSRNPLENWKTARLWVASDAFHDYKFSLGLGFR
ncbi:hypothetical protein Vi05172_g3552 [Venturia inaequalis]|nr:hypothetical protein Vi05172_g3552 [Venturia inaequalis]